MALRDKVAQEDEGTGRRKLSCKLWLVDCGRLLQSEAAGCLPPHNLDGKKRDRSNTCESAVYNGTREISNYMLQPEMVRYIYTEVQYASYIR